MAPHSRPRGSSVNDRVEPDLCSMKYTSVDVATKKVLALGQGSLLAKFDVESAYRNVQVHPGDRWLLGMRWRDQLYVDKVLSFDMRSARKIYSAVADGLQWILREAGVDLIHCLDDFLVASRPGVCEAEASSGHPYDQGASIEPGFLGHRIGHSTDGGETPRQQAAEIAGGDPEVGSQEGVYEEAVTLIDWSAPACWLCGQTRQVVLEEDDRSGQRGAGAPPQGEAEPKVQVVPAIVGMLPTGLQR